MIFNFVGLQDCVPSTVSVFNFVGLQVCRVNSVGFNFVVYNFVTEPSTIDEEIGHEGTLGSFRMRIEMLGRNMNKKSTKLNSLSIVPQNHKVSL
jgi:hypothetical protein